MVSSDKTRCTFLGYRPYSNWKQIRFVALTISNNERRNATSKILGHVIYRNVCPKWIQCLRGFNFDWGEISIKILWIQILNQKNQKRQWRSKRKKYRKES